MKLFSVSVSAFSMTRANSADDSIFTLTACSFGALIPMTILVLTADIGFVNFDDTHQLAEIRISEARAKHVVRSGVRAKGKHPMHLLQYGNALFACQHEVNNFEPCPHRDIGVLEDCADQDRKAVACWRAIAAKPTERTSCELPNFLS